MLIGLGVAVLVARRRRWLTLLPFLGLLACSDDPVTNVPVDGGTDASADVAVDAPPENVDGGTCTTTFRFAPPSGSAPKTVTVAGEWNAFASPGTPMTGPDAQRRVDRRRCRSRPASCAYKLVVDGTWQLDPARDASAST